MSKPELKDQLKSLAKYVKIMMKKKATRKNVLLVAIGTAAILR